MHRNPNVYRNTHTHKLLQLPLLSNLEFPKQVTQIHGNFQGKLDPEDKVGGGGGGKKTKPSDSYFVMG